MFHSWIINSVLSDIVRACCGLNAGLRPATKKLGPQSPQADNNTRPAGLRAGPPRLACNSGTAASISKMYRDFVPISIRNAVPAPPVWLVRFSPDRFWLCPIPFVLEYPNQPDHFSL